MTTNNTAQLFCVQVRWKHPVYKDWINRIRISPTTQVIDRFLDLA